MLSAVQLLRGMYYKAAPQCPDSESISIMIQGFFSVFFGFVRDSKNIDCINNSLFIHYDF